MEKEQMSLKNLYKIITERDYLTYSSGVLPSDGKVGLTVNKFWQNYLCNEFRNQKIGRLIWREEGSRNTYTSLFINNSERFRRYDEYREEILFALSEDLIISQVTSFADFLISREFDYEELNKKIAIICEPYKRNDDPEKESMRDIISISDENDKFFEDCSTPEKAFHASWKYTMLVLCALCNVDLDDIVIPRKLNTIGVDEIKLYKKAYRKTKVIAASLRTNANNQICTNRLENEHFFGREEEMFDMIERVKYGGKFVISGIGGIGKTEILRQLYRTFMTNGVYENIYTFQFERTIAESFVRGQKDRSTSSIEERFIGLRKEIGSIDDVERAEAEKNTNLILIDNVDQDITADKDFEKLMNLNATIVMTSRMKEMKGFETITIGSPIESSCILIFRDNLGRPLSKEETDSLKRLMKNDLFRHPLTIRLLGKLAAKNGWEVEELSQRFEEKNISKLNELYSLMYTMVNLSEKEKNLLAIVALFPIREISLKFTGDYMFREALNENETRAILTSLSNEGWIILKNDYYSIHPYVAECILQEKGIEPAFFLNNAIRFFFGEKLTDEIVYERIISANRSREALLMCELVERYVEFYKPRFTKETYTLTLFCTAVLQIVSGGDPTISDMQFAAKRRFSENDLVHDVLMVAGYCGAYATKYLPYAESVVEKGVKTEALSQDVCEWVLVTYGDMLMQVNRASEAENVYQELIENSKSIDVIIKAEVMYAMLLFKQGDDSARLHFKRAIRLGDEHVSELRDNQAYASAILNSMIFDIQEKTLEHSLENVEKAEKLIDKSNLTSLSELYSARASINNALGNLAEAEADIKATADVVLYICGKDSVDYAMVCSEYGKLKIFTKEYDVAISYFDRAIPVLRKNPGNDPFLAVTLGNKATAGIRSGRIDEAWEAIQEAVPIADHLGEYYKAKTVELRDELIKLREERLKK